MNEEEYTKSQRYSYAAHFVYTMMLLMAAIIVGVDYFVSP